MVVKKKVRSLDEVPEGLRGEYVQSGGEYVLQLDVGDDGDRRLSEFRENNLRLRKQLEEMEARYKDVDLDQYKAAQAALEKARTDEERALLRAGKFEDVLEMRTQLMRENMRREQEKLATQLKATEGKLTARQERFKRLQLESALNQAAASKKLQFLPSAALDGLARASALFELDENDKLVAIDGGEPRVDDQGKPYSMDHFVADLLEHAPHLFAGNSGGDVNGASRRGAGANRFGGVTVDPSDIKSMGADIDDIAAGRKDARLR